MIDAVYRFYQDYSFKEKMTIALDAFSLLVTRVGLTALSVLVQLTLFHTFPNIAIPGFAVGFFFNDQVQRAIDKTNVVFNSCKTRMEKFLLYVVGGLVALYTLPTSIIGVTIYHSAMWGAYLYKSSLDRLNRYEREHGLPPTVI